MDSISMSLRVRAMGSMTSGQHSVISIQQKPYRKGRKERKGAYIAFHQLLASVAPFAVDLFWLAAEC
jgi:hypothetical protein